MNGVKYEGYGYLMGQALMLDAGEKILGQTPCSKPPLSTSTSPQDATLESVPSVSLRSQDSIFRVSCGSEVPVMDWRGERAMHCVDEILISMYSNDVAADMVGSNYVK